MRSSAKKKVSVGRTIYKGFDAFPITGRNFFLNELGKVFHAEDENVGGEGIPLSNASRRMKGIQTVTIEKN